LLISGQFQDICEISGISGQLGALEASACEPGRLGGGFSPQTRAKPLFCGQKLNFSDRNQQTKMKKVLFIKQKTEFIPSSEIKCPKSRIFTNNYWVGRVGQSNFAS